GAAFGSTVRRMTVSDEVVVCSARNGRTHAASAAQQRKVRDTIYLPVGLLVQDRRRGRGEGPQGRAAVNECAGLCGRRAVFALLVKELVPNGPQAGTLGRVGRRRLGGRGHSGRRRCRRGP